MSEKEVSTLPDEVKDLLQCLKEGCSKFQEYLSKLKEYLEKDRIKNTNTLVEYILKNIHERDFQKNTCYFLPDVIVYIQGVNKIPKKDELDCVDVGLTLHKQDVREKWVDDNYDEVYGQFRIEIQDEKLRRFKGKDYRMDLIMTCTKNVNYMEIMYVLSKNMYPRNGYILFNNILHNSEISYRYKLLSLEYFAHIVNKISLERAKYIAQILPLVLGKFYSIEGKPYYNDNITSIDVLISMCKFSNVLCDESIKTQEDDKQDVALHSIIAFIMKIISYHNAELPINKNIEKMIKYIHYDNLEYEKCLDIYSKLSSNLYQDRREKMVKDCLSGLVWRLSIINSNIPRLLENVNILMPNAKACALENSTLEISILAYLIFVEKINESSFPKIYSELYLLNLIIRNSYNLLLCIPQADDDVKHNLLIKAYHLICLSAILSNIIHKRDETVFCNIYNFRWRPMEFLKTVYRTIHDNRTLKTYSKVVYNALCIIMRNFKWDILYSLYYKLLNESLPDNARSLIASFVKDEMHKQMVRVVKKAEMIKQEFHQNEDFEKLPNQVIQVEKNKLSCPITPPEDNTQLAKMKQMAEEINKLGAQVKNIIYILISEESVLLNVDAITVVLNIIKMILLNKTLKPFYNFIVNIEEPSSCFVQSKIKHFYTQIKLEKAILDKEKKEDANSIFYTNMNGYSRGHGPHREGLTYQNTDVTMNELDIVLMLLGDVEQCVDDIKASQR
ncbi:conserved Plasmodium protein, unknown function [Plasmodium knowlesi strain H]|uniref:Uncharacterized protein n=3 Tax=Plasmodium knowlesi TaxID=5850 RepID=A0A5K1TV15_PLAKH|nr:conserved Plasmodium protein, unknown function [Plasmodium knowlesi strain H]OTN63677.1 Uncharacterized protein PKNOH_S140232500 [Plasmodium knowlesi]CAA9990747.1 conserved Plasmodium protein, unknown function [Plasmodium knowlesi strain H]SBO21164.1 conserved Plasmodium protein, unknown function [Plasmodium knowlesi strain H]SBO21623.1 conserved Plasmodium protein, unknown function [Plasmodium knowlesi strain H]VVS80221.1 conserved Plasmodium protein, unknown function [Plasmodium knowlesi |eukprot:XP_002262036.1 hypothetical protein, conserved in Plasmodium species [Plasmodium knowlesi strain H]